MDWKARGRALAAKLADRVRALVAAGRFDAGAVSGPILGVVVAPGDLGAVMIRMSGARFEVLASAHRELPSDLSPDTPGFASCLGEMLASLPGLDGAARIWVGLWNPSVQARLVTFPAVEAGMVDTAAFFAAKKALGFAPEATVVDIERRGPVPDGAGERLRAMACLAGRDDVASLGAAFARSGHRLSGLTLVPFGLQHLLRRQGEPAGVTANLHLGREWSRLEVCDPDGLAYVRALRIGLAALERDFSDALPRSDTPGADGYGPETVRKVLTAALLDDAPLPAGHPGHGLDARAVLDVLAGTLARLTRQVAMTLSHCGKQCGLAAPQRLTLSGPWGGSRVLAAYLGQALGVPCQGLLPAASATVGAGGVGPETVHALGVALAGADGGVNLLLTFRERALAGRGRRAAVGLVAAVAALVVLVCVFSLRAGKGRRDLEQRQAVLAARLAAFGAATDPAALQRRLAGVAAKRRDLKAYLGRNAVAGLWGEVLSLAPAGVGVATLNAAFARPGAREAVAQSPGTSGRVAPAARAPGNRPLPRLDVSGVVSGEPRFHEALLTRFVAALRRSPCFADVKVTLSPEAGRHEGARDLRFALVLALPEGRL